MSEEHRDESRRQLTAASNPRFGVNLKRYARLLVELVGLRRDQQLFIRGQVVHRALAGRIAEAAYELGAGQVHAALADPVLLDPLIRYGPLEQVHLHHDREQCWYNEIVRSRGAAIFLVGEEDPHRMSELARTHPERHAAYTGGASTSTSGFNRYGINGRLCPFVVAACPTPGWAKIVHPELGPPAAFDRLAEEIFRFTYADQENARERTAAKDRRLKARCRALNALEITEIRVTGGESELTVGFSRQARWRGGSWETVLGQVFHPNVPSEEVFSTPDRRRTQGRLAATMPFRTGNGILVKDLVLKFQNGRVSDFDAGEGRAGFARWLDRDDGARYLGEFALVGQDSPIARSGRRSQHDRGRSHSQR